MIALLQAAAKAAYAEIEAGFALLKKLGPVDPMTLVHTPAERLQQVISIFRGVRPLLSTIAALPFIPATWRAGVQMFIVALDGLTGEVASADFKAGKDL
jgi:hypothetical protein